VLPPAPGLDTLGNAFNIRSPPDAPPPGRNKILPFQTGSKGEFLKSSSSLSFPRIRIFIKI